jgi:16S rRNA C1402 (ribose-2'-O) methylase RsmI
MVIMISGLVFPDFVLCGFLKRTYANKSRTVVEIEQKTEERISTIFQWTLRRIAANMLRIYGVKVHIGTSSCGMCDFRITLIVHGMEEKKISV